MLTRELKKGQLVKSRAGRDKNRFYLVYNWDHEFVYVVDGKYRGIQNPKKKNLRHLWYTEKIAEEISLKLNNGEKVTNADIRKALDLLVAKVDDN
ncbi:MAG: RNA-binding protein [Clostridia bacterium]|nr:RNA-binding protein [Clostridia bacterium]